MNEKPPNDEANADASGTSHSRELGADGDDNEESRTFRSRSRWPNQNDGDARALGDIAPHPPAFPLPLPTRETELADEGGPPVPASEIAAALEEMEEGSINQSRAAASLVTTPLRAVPPPARREVELYGDDEGGIATKGAVERGEGDRVRAEILDEDAFLSPDPQTVAASNGLGEDTVEKSDDDNAPMGEFGVNEDDEVLDTDVAQTAPLAEVEHDAMEQTSSTSIAPLPVSPPVPALRTAAAYEEMEHATRNLPASLLMMPPMPAAQNAAAYEEMEHAMRNVPAPLPTMPPAAVTAAMFEEDGEEEHSAVAYDAMEQTLSTSVSPIPMLPPVPALQTAAAYEEMEYAMRNLPAPLPMIPPTPAAQTAAAYEEMEHAMKNVPAPLPTMPPMPPDATASVVQEDGEKRHSAVAHDAMCRTSSPSVAPRRTQSVVLPIRPPPRSMLPFPSFETNRSVVSFHEVEATLFEQEQNSEVYLGTPVENDLRPWWKKQRMPIAIAVSGLIAGSAVALGATLGFSREPILASSRPSETQSSLPSLEPSRSSPPSKIPSLRPTVHPSQSVPPSSVRSAPPSTSPVPSTSPSSSSSTSPSASTPPTAFCFEGAIKIFTDSHPEDTSWTLSRITTDKGVPTSKVLHEGSPEEESSPHAYEVCLERGEYEFAIYDRFGDGICCDDGAGRFELVLDGRVVLEGGEFGLGETVSFSLPAASLPPSGSPVPSRSMSPTLRPSTSFRPSSQVPSLVPSLSPSPSYFPSSRPTAPPSTYWSSLIWEQKGQTIVGEAPHDDSGFSAVLSGDGTIMAVGSPGDLGNDDRPGYVRVYQREDNASSWQDLGQKIEGRENGSRFGAGLALSEDGRTLAIGAPGHFGLPGYVRMYRMEGDVSGSSWQQLGQDNAREAGGDYFGTSIALSADGRTLAIGDNVQYGFGSLVRIYGWDEDGRSWKQLGQDIDEEGPRDASGSSVDLSSDGMTVAIGAPLNDGNGEDSGHVRVFRWKGDGPLWEQLGQDIDGEAPGDGSGFSVSLSADGRTLAVGGVFNDGNGADAGHARIYRIDETGQSWEQLGQDIDGEAAGDLSGTSSLSADGKTVAIGAHKNDENGTHSGHVKVYRMEDGPNWTQVGRDIDGAYWGDNAGWAVSLSTDGKTVAIGSPEVGDGWGHVRVFNVD